MACCLPAHWPSLPPPLPLPRVAQATESDCRQLLSFVVCGGGPSGVEVAAELHDMIHQDLSRQFPQLMRLVSIRLVEMRDHVLDSYGVAAGAFAAKQFQRAGAARRLWRERHVAVRRACSASGPLANLQWRGRRRWRQHYARQ